MNCHFLSILLASFAGLNLLAASGQEAQPSPPPAFKHPGLLHTKDDLDRIKANVDKGVEPWKGGFAKFKVHAQSKADWKMRGPFESVTRDPKTNLHNTEMWLDANAAYQNALMWAITGDEAHAKKAVEILDGWSATLKEIKGHDLQLAAGIYGFKYVNAAEIMRWTYPQWPKVKVAQCQVMMRGVINPAIKDFATFANGNWDTTTSRKGQADNLAAYSSPPGRHPKQSRKSPAPTIAGLGARRVRRNAIKLARSWLVNTLPKRWADEAPWPPCILIASSKEFARPSCM